METPLASSRLRHQARVFERKSFCRIISAVPGHTQSTPLHPGAILVPFLMADALSDLVAWNDDMIAQLRLELLGDAKAARHLAGMIRRHQQISALLRARSGARGSRRSTLSPKR